MFLPGASPDVILCGIATYLVVAPIFITVAGLCGWLIRQSELAAERETAEGGALPPAPSALAHGSAPAVATKEEQPVSTAA